MAAIASSVIETRDPRLDEILALAAAVFRKRGYHGGTLEDIAKKLRIKRPALYYYFRSKEEILRSLLTQAMRMGLAEVPARDRPRHGPNPPAAAKEAPLTNEGRSHESRPR